MLSEDRCFHLLQLYRARHHNALLINLCRLLSTGKFTLKRYNCFQQPKAHTHWCYQEGRLIIHLLPCYPSQQTRHICAHSCTFIEILRGTAHLRPVLCLILNQSQRLLHFMQKNNWYLKLGNWERPLHIISKPPNSILPEDQTAFDASSPKQSWNWTNFNGLGIKFHPQHLIWQHPRKDR